MAQAMSPPNTGHAAAPTAYRGFENQYIGGRRRRVKSKETINDLNPYTGETVVEIPSANRVDLDEAYRMAADAQPPWAAKLPSERSALMQRTASIMERRREEILGWIIHESGGTRIKATLEWAAVHADFEEAAGVPYRMERRILPSDVPGEECRVFRQPVGVVG